MSDLYSNKNLAGIGALLLIFSPIPGIGLFLGVAGVILLLIGVKRLSEHYQESSMYHNMMLGVVFFIIGLVAITVGAATIYAYTALISLITAILSNLILITGVLIITFLFYLLSAIYFKRAFTKFAQKTKSNV